MSDPKDDQPKDDQPKDYGSWQDALKAEVDEVTDKSLEDRWKD